MAAEVTFDSASNSGFQVASNNYTLSRVVGNNSNRLLSVDVAILGTPGTTVTSVTDDDGGGNVPFTFIGRGSSATGAGIVECWRLVSPVVGTKNIRVQLSGSVTSGALCVSRCNVNTQTPVEAFNSASATNAGVGNDAAVTITPVTDNCVLHGALATDDPSVTPNQTGRNNVSGGAANSGADEDTGPITPPAPTALSYTGEGITATWVIAGYAIRRADPIVLMGQALV